MNLLINETDIFIYFLGNKETSLNTKQSGYNLQGMHSNIIIISIIRWFRI